MKTFVNKTSKPPYLITSILIS